MRIIKTLLVILLGLGPVMGFSILGVTIYASSQNLRGIIGASLFGLLGVYMGYWVSRILLKMGIINFLTVFKATPGLNQ